MARLGRAKTLWTVAVEEIAATVAVTGLSVVEFRQALEDPASYQDPKMVGALFGLGALLVVEPERRDAVVAAAELSLRGGLVGC
jgi:hypothetical protein